jgi:hypothetical protein
MVTKDSVAKSKQPSDAEIRDAIVDLFAVAACLDETAPAQAAEMGRDATLRRLDRRH